MAKGSTMACFKAYDIRGRVPEELNEELAFAIARAAAHRFGFQRVALGHDCRLSSPGLADALAEGFAAAGVEVLELGMCGTEEVYFASFSLDVDGGVMVTASHNPAHYNGIKFVAGGGVPISHQSGLADVAAMVAEDRVPPPAAARGRRRRVDHRYAYIDHLLGYLERPRELSGLRMVVNPGNGAAGPVVEALGQALELDLVGINMEPDGRFPNGVPNPMLKEQRGAVSRAVKESGAQLGVAWDGDFDRCFFFDEQGEFVEGYYMVGVLARERLRGHAGAKVVHDCRLIWNTREVVKGACGKPVVSRPGHAFIKARMREVDGLYGGEMSGHHFFREFGYCDSGMIPWLLTATLVAAADQGLSAMVAPMKRAFPISGEINRRVPDPARALEAVASRYRHCRQEGVDGLGCDCGSFRFNLRCSNTEPLIRLNVESRGDEPLMRQVTGEILRLLDSLVTP